MRLPNVNCVRAHSGKGYMRYEYAQFSSYMRRVLIVAIQQLSQARKVLVCVFMKRKIKDIYMHMSKDIGTELKPQRG